MQSINFIFSLLLGQDPTLRGTVPDACPDLVLGTTFNPGPDSLVTQTGLKTSTHNSPHTRTQPFPQSKWAIQQQMPRPWSRHSSSHASSIKVPPSPLFSNNSNKLPLQTKPVAASSSTAQFTPSPPSLSLSELPSPPSLPTYQQSPPRYSQSKTSVQTTFTSGISPIRLLHPASPPQTQVISPPSSQKKSRI